MQTKFSTWFYRVIINLCLDFKKKRSAQPITEGMEFPAEPIDLDQIMDQQVKAKQLEALIQALPKRQQITLNLSFYEGLSNKESAEIMEINIKALESLLMRAKTKLKSQIKDNDKNCHCEKRKRRGNPEFRRIIYERKSSKSNIRTKGNRTSQP